MEMRKSDTLMGDLISKVADVRGNPDNIQRAVIDVIEASLGDEYGPVDPSNPFIFLLESAAAVGTAAIAKNQALLRQQYPSLAQDAEELYHHMTDRDYLNRFAVPARATFTFLMSVEEIRTKTIEADGGVRKLTIPRDTEIEVEGLTFTFTHPIEIRVMPHGGIQVMYDTRKDSPIKTLESNTLDWRIVRMEGNTTDFIPIEMVTFEVPLSQFKLKSHYDQITDSSGFAKRYPYANQFYYARVWLAGANEEWSEVYTTHSDQIYDPTKPTAILKVLNNELMVHIPQIYFTQEMLSRMVRVDIYTTHGPTEVNLERYSPQSFTANWRDLSRFEEAFVAPIRSFSTMTLYSTDRVTGGKDALSFDELRARVIDNALGSVQTPITGAQLNAQLANLGYDIIKDVDNITNRIYLATRALPAPSSKVVSSGVATNVAMLQINVPDLLQYQGATDHEVRVTLNSGMLFQLEDGRLNPIDNSTRSALESGNVENRVQQLIDNQYLYTPFHYVLDMTENQFDLRAYHFDRPRILSKEFVQENETLLLEVSTLRFGISRHDDGFKIVLITRSGDVFKDLRDDQVHVQLGFLPPGEVDRAYMSGTLVGRTDDNEYIVEFDIRTTFDVTKQDYLQLRSFTMFDATPRNVSTLLSGEFDVFYGVSEYTTPVAEVSDMDNHIGRYLVPADTKVVVQEKLRVEFGVGLDGLWRRARTVADSMDYLRYEDDVPGVYEANVYKRDPVTGVIDLTRDPDTGDIVYSIEHRSGDPILDEDGNQVLRYQKGEVKLDNDGNPIPISPRKLLRQMDLLLFEGALLYVTDNQAMSLRTDAKDAMVSWVTQDVGGIRDELLENTALWFYPQTTLGRVPVIVGDGERESIEATQSFDVRLYLSRVAYDNFDLRTELTRICVETIASHLTRRKVSVGEMAEEIRRRSSEDILDVVVSGLGNNYDVVTLTDSSTRLSIKKRPIVLANNNVSLQDDVAIEFIRHSE